MKFAIASLVLLPILALAAPVDPDEIEVSTAKGQNHCPYQHPTHLVAKYDDLPFSDFYSTPIPDGYLGLSYQNFYTDEFDGFIHPASYNNTIISYDFNIPRVITVPASAGMSYTFSPKSIYVGCSSGYPQDDCYITLIGTKYVRKGRKWRKRVVKKTVVYPALDNTKKFEMKKIEFGREWKGLRKLEFADVGFKGNDYRPGFIADDFEYVAGCP